MSELTRGDSVFHPKHGWVTVDSDTWHDRGTKKRRIKLESGETKIVAETRLFNQEPEALAEPVPELPTLDDVVAATLAKDLEAEHRAELKRLVATEKRQRRIEESLERCLTPFSPTPLARVPERDTKLPIHEDILVLSDWHVGLKMTMEESGGLYEQDTATTRAQVTKLWRAVEHLHQIDSSGRDIRKLHILFLGDLVEGSGMRPSQSRKVDTVVTEQTVNGFDQLTWLVRMAAQIFPEVEVEMVGGNHDRVSQKPGDGGLGELSYVDNYTWLAGAFLQRVLANDPRIKVRNWTTFFGYKDIMGLKTVFEHGSSFKWSLGSYGGVPWYAISNLAPKYAAMLGKADLITIGHGHRPALLPQGRGWILTNGALPATSTYVQAGQKVISRPLQWKLSVHQEYGITDFKPLYADVPEALVPGAVWDDPDFYAARASSRFGG